MVLEKAREIFNKLDLRGQLFVVSYFKDNKNPNRWQFSLMIKSLSNKWLLSKGFDYFKQLSDEELDELKKITNLLGGE